MGQNKALMPFCGEPLIERVLRRTSGLADEIFITTDLLGKLDYLGLPLISDILPGKGAPGGLYTALATAANSEVIMVACDMPFVNPRLLLAECDLLSITQTDTVIPVSLFGNEPFHAVYRTENCLTAVQRSLDAGYFRLSSWLSKVWVREMVMAEMAVYDPDFNAYKNVNTPLEFTEAESLAR
jgi:molybdopterin-guanine dinucleotide biosynthesis protein A